jgi:DNA-binding PadR family transcriptional regulator
MPAYYIMGEDNESRDLLQLKGFLSFLILHELEEEKLCGEDLALRIGRRKGKVLTPGTIYPALKKLHKKRLVKYRKDGRKKYYRLTDKGKEELESLYKEFSNYFYGLKHKIKRKWYEPLPDDASFYD